ncbi:MAG: DUF169 domain-containing protein [Thermoplasmata archaeon]|nr:DUF169 domain-containing protein [Thermoplasmata archaeon]
MTEEMASLAQHLMSDLELTRAPVQISYLDEPPHRLAKHAGTAPSVCTYFAEGEKKPFYVDLKDHEACEIGAFVLGIAPEGDVGKRLMDTVGMMQREGYLAPGDEAKIPRNEKAPRYVAYGPLGSLPTEPTNVLMFAKAKSIMLAMEAAPGGVPVNGRPMCSLVPTLNKGTAVAMSVGCIGSRVFTGIGDGEMLLGVRGDHLKTFAQSVRKIRHANDLVGAEDEKRKAAAAKATHPSGGGTSR